MRSDKWVEVVEAHRTRNVQVSRTSRTHEDEVRIFDLDAPDGTSSVRGGSGGTNPKPTASTEEQQLRVIVADRAPLSMVSKANDAGEA